MIVVHFIDDRPALTFEAGDTADISANGFLRISKHSPDALDEQLGAVAPGWQYYTVTENAEPATPAADDADSNSDE